jgi:histidinol-phosphate phosphatase family protein
VFLDRDGTIILDRGYVSRPDAVELLPGAARAIRRLNDAGWLVVVVSNQSGIGRGMYGEEDFERVQARVAELLAAGGARLDAVYHCPHAPDQNPPCDCRKPGTKLFVDAAADHAIDLPRSWFVGDRWRDVAAAESLGGWGILVPTDDTDARDIVRAEGRVSMSTTLGAAVDRILSAP